jgi:hypothetical protein
VNPLVVVVAGLVASALTSAWSARAWFVGDDLGEILRSMEGDPRHTHERPLVALLLRASFNAFGLHPTGYHLVSVVLHAAVIVLVGWVAFGLAVRRDAEAPAARRFAWLAGATFAVLATHSEAVSWISTRGDLLAAGGALVAVGSWVRREERWWWRWVAVVALAIALASKEQAVAVPILCLVVAGSFRVRTARQVGAVVVEASPLLLGLAAYVVIRAVAIGNLVGSYEPAGAFDWNPLHLAARLVLMTVRTVVPGMGLTWWVGVGVALGVLASVAAVVGLRHQGEPSPAAVVAAEALVLTVVAVLPGIGLGVSMTDVRGDRLIYSASAFAAIGVAAAVLAVADAITRPAARRSLAAVVAVLLVMSAAGAVQRDLRWKHAGELSARTLRDSEMWRGQRDVVVLNPVDDLQGAYVHRNALGEAGVVAHGWSGIGAVSGVAMMSVDDGSAVIEATRIDRFRWRLTARSGGATFQRGPGGADTWETNRVRAHRIDGHTVVFDLPHNLKLEDVWFVTGGELVRLDPPLDTTLPRTED